MTDERTEFYERLKRAVRNAGAAQEAMDQLTGQHYLYAQGKQWVPLEDVRKAWKQWKQAWGKSDSEEAYALMEMDLLLGVNESGDPV